MNATPCAACTINLGTSVVACDVDCCGNSSASCAACVANFKCTNCEYLYCSDHLAHCMHCGTAVCIYCAEKLHGSADLLAPACVAAAAAGVATGDAIASHPLAKQLPWHGQSVLTDFSPPLKLLTYRYSKAARKNGTRPADVQAEHFLPNSCFFVGPGRKGPLIPHGGNYSEDNALTYWVKDDQKAGTEHKYLTDRERAFSGQCSTSGQFASLEQWCDFMQHVTVKSILMHRAHKPAASNPGAATAGNNSLHAAQQAAYVIRQMTQYHFEHILGVAAGTALRNGISLGPVPPAVLATAQRFIL
jgi:hypothetical protein